MGSNKDFNGYTYSSNYYKVISDDTNSISGATGSNYYGFLGADESYGLISNSTNNPITAYGNTSDYSASGVDNPLTYTDVTMFSGGSFTDILYSRAAFALRRNSDLWIFGNAAFGGGSSNNITSINNVSQVKSGSIGFITVQSNGEAKMYAQGANPRTFSNGSVRTITVTSNCFGILNTSNLFSTYCSSYFNNSLSSSPVYEISNVSQVYSLDRAGFLLKKTNGTYEYLENHSGSQSIFPDPYPLTGITDSGGITENK